MKRRALISIAVVALVYAVLAWHRRWISDDGLIFVRVVRNILDGHGPVFNAFERTEANTSALWPWILALVGGITRANLSHVAIGTGLVFSIAGMVLAMDGSRRWHGDTVVPMAIIIPIALFPFWDYATSGLETGLSFLWLGAIWWLVVQLAPESTRRRQLWSSVAFGLGPLIRPDLAVASGTFIVAAGLLVGANRRRWIAIAAAAGASPVVFEIFRAGFYGALVPLPALSKSAGHAVWDRGWMYLTCYVGPLYLWVPMLALVAVVAIVARRRGFVRRERILIAAPLVAALVMAIYVVRVGGDFMYARMWLPITMLAIVPAAMLPWRRFLVAPLAIIGVWAVAMITHDYTRTIHHINWLVEDERVGYVQWTKKRNPVDESAYIGAIPILGTTIDDALAHRRRILYTEGGTELPLDPSLSSSPVFIAGRLGLGGALVPTDGIAVDTLGLANPIGARITLNHPEEPPGHQKVLPWSWLLADYADPKRIAETDYGPVETATARRAMQCGELKELLESVRSPMTVGRFFSNLMGAFRRSRLEIPPDPVEAEIKFCGSSPLPEITASSSCENWGWGKNNVVDGRTTVVIGKPLGYSSTVHSLEDHAEWLEINYPAPRQISTLRIYPRDDPGFVGAGFPIDFKIQTWSGTTWIDQVTKTGYPVPNGPQTFDFATPVTTTKLRISATHLQKDKVDGYVMQLAEIEI